MFVSLGAKLLMDNGIPHAELKKAIREAARWHAVLLSPAATNDEQAAWQEWLQQAPSHCLAWQQVEQVQADIRRVPSDVALPALRGAALSRRDLLRRLAVIALTTPVGWAAWRIAPWQQWQAQYITATGEQQSLTLQDGGSLVLNTATSMDVCFSDSLRLLALHKGEVLVQTTADQHLPARPFVVETRHGRVEALGTRFIVRVSNQGSDVTVLDKKVRITPTHSLNHMDIKAGQQLYFNNKKFNPIMPAKPHADSWVHGSLMVVDMPLRELLEELSRYRRGLLSCSDDIADLKISGAFPLNETDRALTAITRAFPIREQRMTEYWVRLTAI